MSINGKMIGVTIIVTTREKTSKYISHLFMYVPSGNPSVVIPESGKVTLIDFVKAPDDVIFVIVSINCSAVTPTVEEIV